MTWFRVHGGGGGEDVSEEVAVQTPLIQQIREMIVGKATDANATEDTIVKGYSAYVGQKLVNGGYIANGAHIWREFTEKDGILIRNVSSDDESAYPVDGEKDGKYYKKVFEGAAGIDFGTVKMASTKSSVTVEHNLGVVPRYAVIVLVTSWYLRYEDIIVLAGSSGFLADHGTASPTVYGSSDKKTYSANENTITFNDASVNSNYINSREYLWFAMA